MRFLRGEGLGGLRLGRVDGYGDEGEYEWGNGMGWEEEWSERSYQTRKMEGFEF